MKVSQAGDYTCVVSNPYGQVTSATATLAVHEKTAILTQPQNQTATIGDTVVFSVVAKGTPAPTYQWKFNGAALAGETSADLVLSNVQFSQAGKYRVRVTNPYGAVDSVEVTLSLTGAPEITVQPQSLSAMAGTDVVLKVTAIGKPAPGYQWARNGVPLGGATGASLSLKGVQPDDAGEYTVTVFNVLGAVVGEPATLTVNFKPKIVEQPKNLTAIAGTAASLTVGAQAFPPPDYQWKYAGAAMFGANDVALEFPEVQLSHAGKYRVVVSNPHGSVESTEVTLKVVEAPAIVSGPQSQTAILGSSVTFQVAASGTGPLAYQWFFQGAPISTATGTNLVRSALKFSDAGSYSVRVSNAYAQASSEPAQLTVVSLPTFTVQPQSQTVAPGSDVVLSAEATSVPAPRYQWTLNGDSIPGATEPTLTLTGVQSSDGGAFAVEAFNQFGATESKVAVVKVEAPQLPFADDYANRGVITASSGSGHGTNLRAGRTGQEPLHAGRRGKASVWLSWVPSQSGVATMSTDGSAFDTLLAVYTGTAINALQEVASDEDSAGYHTSLVRFNAVAGTTYDIAVDGFDRAEGDIVLNWDLFVTEEKLPQILKLTPSPTVSVGATLDLAVEYFCQTPVSVQWLFNGQEIPEATAALLTLPNFQDANVGQYRARLSTGELVYFTSEIDVQINSEGLVNVAAKNKPSDAYDTRLTMLTPTASGTSLLKSRKGVSVRKVRSWKDFDVVHGYSGTQMFWTYPGNDADEPNHCGVVGGASYWFSYQAPDTGILTLNTDGSSFDTVLAVYVDNGSGQGYASLVSVACNNNSGVDGQDSALQFAATSGTIYYIVVDGVGGATGLVYLNYNLNTLPVVSAIASQTIAEDTSTPPLAFTISDRESAASSLVVSGRSSNTQIVPNSFITFGGSGGSRTVTVRPAQDRQGSVNIYIDVRDAGGALRTQAFSLSISPVNDAPVPGDDYGWLSSYSRTIYFYIPSLLRTDRDVDGDVLTMPSNSTRSYCGSYLIYTAPTTFGGSDFFQYTVSDGKGGSATGNVRIYSSAGAGI
ncbi:MAG: immunoglobulin domain-containing protein [Verrucomicrobia bacterium]|nr:immunoglobulin domain-containing protein [Verrucomicrobiota bacterium]